MIPAPRIPSRTHVTTATKSDTIEQPYAQAKDLHLLSKTSFEQIPQAERDRSPEQAQNLALISQELIFRKLEELQPRHLIVPPLHNEKALLVSQDPKLRAQVKNELNGYKPGDDSAQLRTLLKQCGGDRTYALLNPSVQVHAVTDPIKTLALGDSLCDSLHFEVQLRWLEKLGHSYEALTPRVVAAVLPSNQVDSILEHSQHTASQIVIHDTSGY